LWVAAISISIDADSQLIWSVALFAQAGCHNFGGLFVCRLILGICEGSITAGYLIITSMFYTHAESSRRVGYWFLMNGTAQIFSGLVSFGVYHIDATKFAPWRAFMIICGGLTLVMALVFYWFIPDSPLTAKFLTEEDKAIAINRLAKHSSGIENKHWKKEQFVEALKDWKVWAVSAASATSVALG
jgi:MFS family permease